MTRFEHCLVAGSIWIINHILKSERIRPPSGRPGSCGPKPGPHWKAFEVVVREVRQYGVTIYGWSDEHVQSKARLLWVRQKECGGFDWTEIETLDMEVREAR